MYIHNNNKSFTFAPSRHTLLSRVSERESKRTTTHTASEKDAGLYLCVCVRVVARSLRVCESGSAESEWEREFCVVFIQVVQKHIIAIQLQDFWEIRHNFSEVVFVAAAAERGGYRKYFCNELECCQLWSRSDRVKCVVCNASFVDAEFAWFSRCAISVAAAKLQKFIRCQK